MFNIFQYFSAIFVHIWNDVMEVTVFWGMGWKLKPTRLLHADTWHPGLHLADRCTYHFIPCFALYNINHPKPQPQNDDPIPIPRPLGLCLPSQPQPLQPPGCPAQVFTRYTDSAFPSTNAVDESLRFSLRYEVGAFYRHLRELEKAVEEKNLPGGGVGWGWGWGWGWGRGTGGWIMFFGQAYRFVSR